MSKILVAYFSITGTTRSLAQLLSKEYKANLYEIKAKISYKSADMAWDDNSRCGLEAKNKLPLPEITDKNAGIEKYEVILLCFPIWWSIAPKVVNTFLKSYNFKGKKIILFGTSTSSGFGDTLRNLKSCVDATTVIEEGKLIHGKVSQNEVSKWAKSLKI